MFGVQFLTVHRMIGPLFFQEYIINGNINDMLEHFALLQL